MSYSSKKQMFREFSVVDQRYIKKNYLKNLRNSFQEFCKNRDIFPKELNFMLWAYDLDFFTIKYASENYKMDKKRMGDHIVYPLMKEKYIYKVYDKLTPSQTLEDHLFRDETKYNYRVRYSLTKKARMLVQAFYDNLENYS
jgi:hypothetical protein